MYLHKGVATYLPSWYCYYLGMHFFFHAIKQLVFLITRYITAQGYTIFPEGLKWHSIFWGKNDLVKDFPGGNFFFRNLTYHESSI